MKILRLIYFTLPFTFAILHNWLGTSV